MAESAHDPMLAASGGSADRFADEPALLAGLRAGSDEAFAELVRRYGGRLLAVIKRILHRDDDAQDALQEAFISAFRGLPKFDGNAQLGTWLHRIAVNAALMRVRSNQRRRDQSIEDLLPKFDSTGHREQAGPAWRVTADQILSDRETRELVRKSIDELPDNYRLVLVLRDIEQMDTADVAQALGVEPGAVKTRLHRARQALRTLLDPHFRAER